MLVKKILLTTMQMGLLYLFYRIGLFIQQTFHLFVPGSMIGMLLFFMLLIVWKPMNRLSEQGATFYLNYLPLFFIPATVGVIDYFSLFMGKGFLIIVITIVSTLLVLIGSSYTSQLVLRWKGKVRER